MNSIEIFDTTLRDGEQSPGANLNSNEKLQIAYALKELGVDIIEAGFPISSEEDYNAVKDIAKKVKGVGICGLSRTIKKDIDNCYEAVKYSDRPRIHTFIATSPIHMKEKLKLSPLEVIEITKESVAYTKSLCPEVQFCLEDATRTEYPFMIEVIKTAILSGADIINIPDTVGYAVPLEIRKRIKYIFHSLGELIEEKNVKLSVHCHNDLGNAVANSLEGIKNGVSQVECTINGIGERAGNASLEEIIMNLVTRKDYYKTKVNVNTRLLYPTSVLVSNLTGLLVQRNKAIVGENAFAHEAGIHQAGVIACRGTYEIMNSEEVGWVGDSLVLGKHSGKGAVKNILTTYGITVEDAKIDSIVETVKRLGAKKKYLNNSQILELAKT
jgi:2-isopropylmalate synthase